MQEVNENSTAMMTINFTNEDGIPVNPTRAVYSISDFFSGEGIRGNTVLNVDGSECDILLSQMDNSFINPNYLYELRVISSTYSYDPNRVKTDEYMYKVINMKGVPPIIVIKHLASNIHIATSVNAELEVTT